MSKQDEQDRGLWQKFKKRLAHHQDRTCPDAALLAAYIDGVISEHESDRIESHFVYCSHCLSSFLSVKESPGDVGQHPSPALIRQLKSLKPEKPIKAHFYQSPSWNWREILLMRLKPGMGWAAAAAFIIIASAGGYKLGQETSLLKMHLAERPAVEAPFTFERPGASPFTEDVL
jgi:hypothetical protein